MFRISAVRGDGEYRDVKCFRFWWNQRSAHCPEGEGVGIEGIYLARTAGEKGGCASLARGGAT